MPTVVDRGGLMVTRDLTQAFRRQRKARRRPAPQQSRSARYQGLGSTESLILAEGGPATPSSSRGGEGPSLPPQWVDFSDKAHEDIKEIRAQLVQLTKAQQRRLLKVKIAEGSDKEIQALSSSIATLIRCCEQSIHQVRTYGAGNAASLMDDEFRQNVQRSLAAQLQQLSKQCREAQKEYLTEVQRRRQHGADLESGSVSAGMASTGSSAGREASGNVQAMQTVQTTQDFELEHMEEVAAMRSTEIAHVAASINELHQIFKDLANLVIEQGTILDRIDYNTEKIYKRSDEAKGQMQKTVKKKKASDSRVMKCFLFWVAADTLLLLMLLVKYQIKYGLQNVFWFLCCVAAAVGACVLYGRRRHPQLLSGEHWQKLCPDLDPKAIWRRLRPGPINTAKAAGAAARVGGMGAMRQAVRGPGG